MRTHHENRQGGDESDDLGPSVSVCFWYMGLAMESEGVFILFLILLLEVGYPLFFPLSFVLHVEDGRPGRKRLAGRHIEIASLVFLPQASCWWYHVSYDFIT